MIYSIAHKLQSVKIVGIIIFTFAKFVFAQAPYIQWEHSYGGSGDDGAYSIEQTTDGGFIIAGGTNSLNGDVTGYHVAFEMAGHLIGELTSDIWVVKLDSLGKIQWEHCYGGSGDDDASSILQTADGGYIVAGSSNSIDGEVTGKHLEYDSSTESENYDYWIIKLDAFGDIQWEKCYGGSEDDLSSNIQSTNDGGYIICGYSFSNNGDVIDHHGDSTTADYWIVKIDSMGNLQWEKSLGGTQGDYANSIQQTINGGYIVAGYTESTNGDVTGNNGIGGKYWIVKLDLLGNIQWENCYGGNGVDDGAYSIQQTSDSGFIVAGFSQSTDGEVTGNHGENDYWIIKLDTIGAIQWEKCYGGFNQDLAYSIKQTTDRGYIIAGFSYSNDDDVSGNMGIANYWIVKINSIGAIQWQKCLGGSDYENAYSIQPLINGGFIIAGVSLSSNGDVTGHHMGYDYITHDSTSDIWIVKLIPPPPIISSMQQQIFPNELCNQVKYDTLYIHNLAGGGGQLVVDSLLWDIAGYSLISPALPAIIYGGDSSEFIFSFNPSSAGTFNATLSLYSNDSVHHPWQINFSGVKDSIGFDVQRINNDTLDFGDLACGETKDTSFFILNTSNVPTSFTPLSDDLSLFTVTGENQNGSIITYTIHCAGGASGTSIVPLFISDTCGKTDTIYMKASMHGIAVILAQHDTTICSGENITLHAPSGYMSYLWSDGETTQNIVVDTSGTYWVTAQELDSCLGTSNSVTIIVAPDPSPAITHSGSLQFCDGGSVTLSAPAGFSSYQWSNGDTSRSIVVKTAGEFSVTVTNAYGCTGSSSAFTTSLIPLPKIDVTVPQAITLCAGENGTQQAMIRNLSFDTLLLVLASETNPLFAISPDTLTIAPGDSEIVAITFHGAPDSGVYTADYSYIDACGGAHNITGTVTVSQLPPLHVSLQPDSNAMIIGGELKVYVIANPISSIANGLSFTVSHEPTALQLDSIATPCSAQTTKTNDAATITINACPQLQSDTIATLYYQTLFGYTDTPFVRLQNVTTTNTCDTVMGSGNNIIVLSLPGCDLGQAILLPYTSGINSIFPNPNSGTVTVQYSTIEQANVTLALCDELGRTVQTVVNAIQKPGTYTVQFSTNGLMDGVYFMTMQEGKYYGAREVWVLK